MDHVRSRRSARFQRRCPSCSRWQGCRRCSPRLRRRCPRRRSGRRAPDRFRRRRWPPTDSRRSWHLLPVASASPVSTLALPSDSFTVSAMLLSTPPSSASTSCSVSASFSELLPIATLSAGVGRSPRPRSRPRRSGRPTRARRRRFRLLRVQRVTAVPGGDTLADVRGGGIAHCRGVASRDAGAAVRRVLGLPGIQDCAVRPRWRLDRYSRCCSSCSRSPCFRRCWQWPCPCSPRSPADPCCETPPPPLGLCAGGAGIGRGCGGVACAVRGSAAAAGSCGSSGCRWMVLTWWWSWCRRSVRGRHRSKA